MGKRSDFGADWSEVVSQWYLGQDPQLPPAEGWAALGTLERLWPKHLTDTLSSPAKAPQVFARSIDIGFSLAACEQLPGFDAVLARIHAGNHAGISEVHVASDLVRLGYKPCLQVPLGKKMLDMAVNAAGETVYVEVVTPETSKAWGEAYSALRELVQRLHNVKPGTNVEVSLLGEPATSDADRVYRELLALPVPPSGDDMVFEIPSLALVRYGPYRSNLVPFERAQERLRSPRLFVTEWTSDGKARTRTTVECAMSDARAEQFIRQESQHFSREESNLLVIDVSAIPGAISSWRPLVKRRFQPTRHTRFGAVGLFQLSPADGRPVISRRWVPIQNPHAIRSVPKALLDGMRVLDGQVRRAAQGS